jgi:exonuclease III
MDKNRTWEILNLNLRGINSEKKWLALSSKIEESGCDIICLQETKRESFTMEYIRKFRPRIFSEFKFLPLVGASGGVLTVWNGALFKGELAFQNDFTMSVKFASKLSKDEWILTNVYGPCAADRKV